MNDADFKICPFCKETIRAKAIKCRYCGEWLSDSQTASATLHGETNTPALPDQPAQPFTDQPTPTSCTLVSDTSTTVSTEGERRGLKRMNGVFVGIYTWVFGASILGGPARPGYAFALILYGVILIMVSGSLFGFLASRNATNPTRRRLAKWSNLLVVALALATLLISVMRGRSADGGAGYNGSTAFYGMIVAAFLWIPALINLRAFWKQQPNSQTNGQCSEPSPGPPAEAEGDQSASAAFCETNAEGEETAPESATPIQSSGDEDEAPPEAVPAEAPQKRRNYLIRHWHGDLSLGVSYWANCILGTFLVTFASNMLVQMQESIGLRCLAVSLLVLYVFALVVSVWQAVGVWRSAGKHTSRGGSSGWATAARVAVGFGVLSTIGIFINNYVPQSAEMLRILAGDKSIPAYTIRILPGGTEIEFRGGLRAGCAKDVEKIFGAAPQARVLHIESIGGRIIEAKAMSKLVRAREMTTYTSECCLSAATLVLMAGRERVIATGARVGFHAGRFPGLTSEQMRAMNDTVRSTMEAAGVSASFINRVLSTPNDQMWYPSFDEMRSAGVITSQSAGERFASSWGMPDVNLEAEVESLSTYPCFKTIKMVEPDTFGKMMSNYVAALRSGKSEGEAMAAISDAAGNMMGKYLPAASDEAVLAMRDQWIGILSTYKDRNSKACIAAFTQAKINYNRVFPDWDMTNSLVVMEKIIISGAGKVPVPIDKDAADLDLNSVLQPLRLQYGDDVQLLAKRSAWPDNSQKVCDILLLCYQQIAALPDKRSANLIRYLLTSE